MSKIITTDNGQQYKTPGFWPTAGAVVVGNMAAGTIKQAVGAIQMPIMEKIKKVSQSVDTVTIQGAVEKAYNNSGLAGKGVEILDVRPVNDFKIPYYLRPLSRRSFEEGGVATTPRGLGEFISDVEDALPEANKKLQHAISEEMPGWFRNTYLGKIYRKVLQHTFENGNNAAYFPKSKKIGVNLEKLGLSSFHEMGHAINRNMSTFWGGMQKLRGPAMIASSAIAITGLIKRKKVEGEQPQSKWDKFTTFIKNNVGKLTALAFTPVIAEELMATHRGNKMAKEVLSAENFKKVKTLNKFGAATYIMAAAVAGVGAFAASKIRDLVAAPKKVKQPKEEIAEEVTSDNSEIKADTEAKEA